MIGAITERKSKDEKAARAVITEALDKCDPALWPYPIVRQLDGKLSADELFKLSTDNEKMTESRAYLGLYLAASGKRDEGLTHLRWVKESGKKDIPEHAMAVAELEGLKSK